MKTTGIFILVMMASFWGHTQTYKIQKAWAFVTESMPGRVMADEQGNTITPQPKMERFIYVETNYKKTPVIDSVVYNDIAFKPSITFVKQTKHQAGSIYVNGRAFYISVKKGNSLWRINLEPLNETPLSSDAVKKITLKGKLGKTSFRQLLYAETRLTGPEYQ